jgi:CheY-like chemotaxis protein
MTARPAILVVEDDAHLRVALARLFSEHAYEAALVADGVEAIQWLEEHVPCALILDLLMPGIVGQKHSSSARQRDAVRDSSSDHIRLARARTAGLSRVREADR